MCGIVGIASSVALAEIDTRIASMMRRIAHRGPDDSGVRIDAARQVALGHQRLSIIDLSPAGHQPMTEVSGRLWLIFNGEIYNFEPIRAELEGHGHAFRSGSDSEVILYAYRQWGRDCVKRFNGMFALAIFDEDAQTLFVARDRIGKKPLYYSHDGTTFLFGSEAKAVVAGRTDREWPLDPDALNEYLTFGYILRDRSIFAGLRRLLPGHWMTYDLRRNELKTQPYWQPAAPAAPVGDGDTEELLRELESLADDSVRLRMIADVPLGVLLSGGVDSSIITALAARHSSRPVKTFTVTFPGGGVYDESEHARIVARHFGTEHHELPLPNADLELMRTLAHHLDEPLADPSVLPTYLISKLTRQHVTVALGGDGGDELFGGYGWYRDGVRMSSTRIPRVFRAAAARAAGLLPLGVRGRNYIRARGGDLLDYLITNSSVFDAATRRRLLKAGVANLDAPDQSKRALWPSVNDEVLQMSMLDLQTYLPDDILVKVDRASMAFALEMRAPLLDYRIVEFALQRVPSRLKVGQAGSRYLQRELARRLLPPELNLQRKQGFVMPIHEWLAGEWGDATLEALSAPEVGRWLDPKPARALLEGQRKGRTNGVRLFTLLMLALWLEGVAKPAAAAPVSCEVHA